MRNQPCQRIKKGNARIIDAMPILKTCQISGLPLGYIPPTRVHVFPAIAFKEFSWEDVRIFVGQAIHEIDAEQAQLALRFAFCSLLYQIPAPLMQLHHTPKPNWELLKGIITPHGIRTLAETVETLRSLPPRFYTPRAVEELDRIDLLKLQSCIFPPFFCSQEFNKNTTGMESFPQHLNRWIQILKSNELTREEAKRRRTIADFGDIIKRSNNLWSGPKKKVNERLCIFDGRRSSPKELKNYARQMAALLDVEPTRHWHSFCAQPFYFPTDKLHNVLANVRLLTAGEADYLSEEIKLCNEFIFWLEVNLIRSENQETESREIDKFMKVEEISQSIAMEVVGAVELLARINAQAPASTAPASTAPAKLKFLAAPSIMNQKLQKMHQLLNSKAPANGVSKL